MPSELTDRHKRELTYHRERALAQTDEVRITYDVLRSHKRRWWNAYWRMYTILLQRDLRGKKALVVGCGFGDDALLLAKMGAQVWAFDLSPESLDLAGQVAAREHLQINFQQMVAEDLQYEDSFFDLILARDVLHHCDLSRCVPELVRVSKRDAFIIIDELYTDSRLDRIRHSRFVENWLYPRMVRFIYQRQDPYITKDERKLDQHDKKQLDKILAPSRSEYFNCLSGRLIPQSSLSISKLDWLLLRLLWPLAPLLAGRFLLFGSVANKEQVEG